MGRLLVRSLSALATVLLAVAPVAAQLGDVRDPRVPQELRVPRELIPPSPVVPPEEALKTFVVEPGFRVELVAAEPLVEDPVQIAFDPDGRLWAVELRGYMHGVDGGGEDLPIGRVVRLEDADGDGRMDRSTVFLDRLVMPRAITHAKGGWLVGAPPHLWHCRDTDGDGRADAVTSVADDFGVAADPKRPEVGNPELAPNHLLWTLDNWIQAGHYEARFRWSRGTWVRKRAPEHGRWGLSQDDWGRIYYNNSEDQLRGNLAPAHYFERNPHHSRWAPLHFPIAKDQRVWPARVSPGVNRGYQADTLNNHRLARFTAACAPLIFRGHLFPAEYYGNAFVAEPAGNLIKRNLLIEHADGTVSARFAAEGREFLASTDERFRPVDLITGPDGALYVADFYHGILQNRNALTTYLRKQILERQLDSPLGLGRIYRVVPVEPGRAPAPTRPRFSAETSHAWVEHLRHPNGWWRDTAQRLLVEERDPSTIGPLRMLARAADDARTRLQALWTLEGMDAIDFETVATACDDPHARVRAGAVRLTEAWLKRDRRPEAVAAILAAARDPSETVRLQAAFSLGEIGTPESRRAMAGLATRDGGNPFIVDGVVSGLAGHESDTIETLLQPRADDAAEPPLRFVATLAACVAARQEMAQVSRLFTRIADPETPLPVALALLGGAQAGIAGTARRNLQLPAPPGTLLALADRAGSALRPPAVRLLESITWPEKKTGRLPARALTREENLRSRAGQVLYAANCAVCHQHDGNGLAGVAPPLAASEWVTGPADRLTRIVLHGLGGPIEVGGVTFNLDMPGAGLLDDEQIASILTFVRRAWGHGADPVAPEFVAGIRRRHAGRQGPWRVEELGPAGKK